MAGREGALWVSADEEIYRVADGRFWGPYTFAESAAPTLYEPLDDTLVVSGGGTFTKLAFDGESIVLVERRSVPWTFASGRLKDGRLLVNEYSTAADGTLERRLLVLEDDRGSGTPIPAEDARPVLSAARELYLQTRRGISRYRAGQLEEVLRFARQARELPAWEERGYGSALREPAQEASPAELAPLVPEVLHQKLHLAGRMYSPGFESPLVIELSDDAYVAVAIAPELRAFAEALGLQLIPGSGEERPLGAPQEKGEPWELYGYLEPSGCDQQPRQKVFHLLEAYPVSMPGEERAVLAAALRAAHPG